MYTKFFKLLRTLNISNINSENSYQPYLCVFGFNLIFMMIDKCRQIFKRRDKERSEMSNNFEGLNSEEATSKVQTIPRKRPYIVHS